jgi:hypothetical protein
VADLAPYLRRVPTDNYPASGGFFVHYVWSPFRAGYDGLYVGCRDAGGAAAAVACLAALTPPAPAPEALPSVDVIPKPAAMPAPLPPAESDRVLLTNGRGGMARLYVDLGRIALVGHSRGGEAVATAAVFNAQPRWSDDANVAFDFGFGIRALVVHGAPEGAQAPVSHP